MKATEQTTQQIERTIKKIAQKFPLTEDASILTDIHLRVSQDSGELLAFDDDENETNIVYVGVLTFGIEVSRNNIFVGWNPNLNLGIGIGGELGFKAGLNFETDGWFNYNDW